MPQTHRSQPDLHWGSGIPSERPVGPRTLTSLLLVAAQLGVGTVPQLLQHERRVVAFGLAQLLNLALQTRDDVVQRLHTLLQVPVCLEQEQNEREMVVFKDQRSERNKRVFATQD